ncbi:MAG: uracil-DNA glycosylase family protein [Pseudomonadales bacterium]
MTLQRLDTLRSEIAKCDLCTAQLPYPPRPVCQLASEAKILIIGQAPGLKVQQSGVPFDDASGERLRHWLGVNATEFYNPQHFAILPMGLCYPGRGKSGDLPPLPICARTWHSQVLAQLTHVKLTLLIGKYAQDHYLEDKLNLTARTLQWRNYWPDYLPIPHPSGRNNIWLKKNPWFIEEVVPVLRDRVKTLL